MTEQLSLSVYTDYGLGITWWWILEVLGLRSVGQLPCLQMKICETDFCGCHAPLFLQHEATFPHEFQKHLFHDSVGFSFWRKIQKRQITDQTVAPQLISGPHIVLNLSLLQHPFWLPITNNLANHGGLTGRLNQSFILGGKHFLFTVVIKK